MTELCLNIGAGSTYIPGFQNIDIDPKADVTLDLGRDALPFDDDSVDLVFSFHTLEHIPNYLHALSEIHRVLRHDGTLLLGLPYVTLTEYNLVNPYHLHHFNEHSFDFFDPERLKGSAVEANEILFRPLYVRYHYLGRFGRLPEPVLTWARRHLFNVVRDFEIGVAAIKDPGARLDESPERIAEMKRRFQDCLAARTPYA